MSKRVALVKFKGYAEHMEYSYFTDIQDLKEGDPVVVPTNNFFSVGVFSRYSDNKQHVKNAEKHIVQKIDVEGYWENIFLGGSD